MDQKTELLLELDIFRKFYTEEMAIISEYFSIHKFFDLQLLMPQKGQDNSFGIILFGEVSIIDDNIENASRTRGDLLGEMALLNSHYRNADFVAASDGEIAIMTFDDIEKLKLKHPYLAVKLISVVTHDIVQGFHQNGKTNSTEYVILLADDNLFSDLLNLVKDHLHIINRFSIITTESLGDFLQQTADLKIAQLLDPNLLMLGNQAIGSLVLQDKVKAIIYLRNALINQAHPASVEAISRLCDVYQVLFSTNLLTANAICQYLE